jgi:hypothetical protein
LLARKSSSSTANGPPGGIGDVFASLKAFEKHVPSSAGNFNKADSGWTTAFMGPLAAPTSGNNRRAALGAFETGPLLLLLKARKASISGALSLQWA